KKSYPRHFPPIRRMFVCLYSQNHDFQCKPLTVSDNPIVCQAKRGRDENTTIVRHVVAHFCRSSGRSSVRSRTPTSCRRGWTQGRIELVLSIPGGNEVARTAVAGRVASRWNQGTQCESGSD